jgi:hypothetical protein
MFRFFIVVTLLLVSQSSFSQSEHEKEHSLNARIDHLELQIERWSILTNTPFHTRLTELQLEFKNLNQKFNSNSSKHSENSKRLDVLALKISNFEVLVREFDNQNKLLADYMLRQYDSLDKNFENRVNDIYSLHSKQNETMTAAMKHYDLILYFLSAIMGILGLIFTFIHWRSENNAKNQIKSTGAEFNDKLSDLKSLYTNASANAVALMHDEGALAVDLIKKKHEEWLIENQETLTVEVRKNLNNTIEISRLRISYQEMLAEAKIESAKSKENNIHSWLSSDAAENKISILIRNCQAYIREFSADNKEHRHNRTESYVRSILANAFFFRKNFKEAYKHQEISVQMNTHNVLDRYYNLACMASKIYEVRDNDSDERYLRLSYDNYLKWEKEKDKRFLEDGIKTNELLDDPDMSGVKSFIIKKLIAN